MGGGVWSSSSYFLIFTLFLTKIGLGTPYLPVTGILPDIHSDSPSYISLQTIMRDQG